MKSLNILIFILLFPVLLFSQELKYNTELHFFFDNTEFSRSNLAIDQTMAGVSLTQELGWKFDGKHHIMGGVNAMKSLGGSEFVNSVNFLAYYQLKDENTLFKAGVFPRYDLLNDYSNFFFQDSIGFYNRTMEGLYVLKGDNKQFVKLWLDWTGLQSSDTRESFFIGASGYKEFGEYVFADFQSYMFHFATTRPNLSFQTVSDNLLGQLSVGAKYSNPKIGLNNLKFSLGILSGFERDRIDMDSYETPTGGVARLDVDFKGFGTENLFYFGQERMVLYNKYGNQLYRGNPFLQAKSYIQNKLYWNFLDNEYVKGQISSRTHFSERKVFFEQMLTVSAQINNDHPKKSPREPTFWERIFPRKRRVFDKKKI